MTLQPVRAQQLWETIADQIRTVILSGELAGGARLVETELAERFETSRGPVREALRELAREGLVAELPRRGTVVSTLTAHDLVEVYAVREAMELFAAKVVIARATDRELGSLEAPLSQFEGPGGYLENAVHDLEFHRKLVGLTDIGRLVTIYGQMLTQTMLLLRTAAAASPALRTVIHRDVHRDILDALNARDDRRAQAAIERHYRTAEERLFAGLEVRAQPAGDAA